MRDIVIGKLVDRTIDDDYAELSERLFGDGNCFNSSEAVSYTHLTLPTKLEV